MDEAIYVLRTEAWRLRRTCHQFRDTPTLYRRIGSVWRWLCRVLFPGGSETWLNMTRMLVMTDLIMFRGECSTKLSKKWYIAIHDHHYFCWMIVFMTMMLLIILRLLYIYICPTIYVVDIWCHCMLVCRSVSHRLPYQTIPVSFHRIPILYQHPFLYGHFRYCATIDVLLTHSFIVASVVTIRTLIVAYPQQCTLFPVSSSPPMSPSRTRPVQKR